MSMNEVLQHMRARPHDARAQSKGIEEMQMFTKAFLDDAAAVELGRQPGVLQVLIATMTNHLHEYGVATGASAVLVGILRHSPQLRAAAATAGAVAALVPLLAKWRCPGAAMALGFLSLGSAEARRQALRLRALEHLAEAWEAEPVFRDNIALAAFAAAQADEDALLRLAVQGDWVMKLEERQQSRIVYTYQVEIDELVRLVHKVKATGHPPAPTSPISPLKLPKKASGPPVDFHKAWDRHQADGHIGAMLLLPSEVKATSSYPATGKAGAPSVPLATVAAPPVPPAAPVAMAEALLGSGRFLTSENEEISLLPKVRWEETPLHRSFLEELRKNPGIRAVCPRVDDIVEDVAEKYDLELQHVKSLKETLQRMGINGAHAVLAYTYDFQEGKQEGNLYFELNKALRRREDRATTKECWGVVVRYALQGLAALEPFQGTVYRGMPHKDFVKKHYDEGRTIEWGAFTSASTSVKSATKFMKDGVLLKIKIHSGRDVSKTSFFPIENEVLLSPKCRFMVTREAYYDKDLGVEVLEMMEQKGDVFKS